MNYKKIYDAICAKTYTDDYTEIHHIIPRCFGGTNKKENLVRLSARAHYICHLLLTKMFPNNNPINQAFLMMNVKSEFQGRKVTKNRFFEAAKIRQSIHMTNNNPMKKPAARKKLSETRKRLIASGELKPRVVGDAEKKALSERMMGDNNPLRRFPEKNPFWGKSYVKGRKWYNNGEVNKYLFSDDTIPEGFVIGMKYQKRGSKHDD